MQKTTLLFLFLGLSSLVYSQSTPLTVPNIGGNKRAGITEYIGLCAVTINYHRPGVKGREGKIWGTNIAHYGFQDLGFGTSKAAPWRAGANENTTISFSTDVLIEGRPLAAGKYGLFMANGPTETTIIFSRNDHAWGSYFYDPTEDALRVVVKNRSLPQSVEWLQFVFTEQTASSAVVTLQWEYRLIPFRVEVDLQRTQLASFAEELQSPLGFSWQAYVQAASYCVQQNYALDRALAWADYAVAGPFVGERNFSTLSTKASVLERLNRIGESKAIMQEAISMGSMNDLHTYGRNLITQNRISEAFDVLQLNYRKNPGQFTTAIGMTRAYSALGNYREAVKYAKTALPLAPDAANKASVEQMIQQLEAGRSIN